MANDILNKSGKIVYASYDAHGTYIVIRISDRLESNVFVLASNCKDKDKKDFESLSKLCEYFGISPCLDDWTGSYEMDCSKTRFKLSEVMEFKLGDSSNVDDNMEKEKEFRDCSDSNGEVDYYTEMTTTHVDKDTYTTEVPPLNLSEHTMKKQAEYTANAVGSALEKLQNTKKNSEQAKETLTKVSESVPYTEEDFYKIVQGANAHELSSILKTKGALLLVSPPGTGKTTTAIELAKYIKGETNSDKVVMVSFSQTTSYNDFIGGLHMNTDGDWELQKGTFFKLCDRACEDSENDIYILILDEINRGNTESIFGEAMSGLSKRGESFKTNIGLDLVVPDNVYIIATMNSTDSSITSLDTALVDRFAIFNMPEVELDTGRIKEGADDELEMAIEITIDAIKDINKVLAKDVYKGDDNKIGYRAMYTNYKTVDELLLVIKYDIKPKVEARLTTLTKQEQDEIKGILNKLINDLSEGK